jgi:hypothetical protein
MKFGPQMNATLAGVLRDAMTMLVLDRGQRDLLSQKLADIANLAAGALVFSQFLSTQQFSPRRIAWGLLLWSVVTACALWVRKGTDK